MILSYNYVRPWHAHINHRCNWLTYTLMRTFFVPNLQRNHAPTCCKHGALR